jgi:hypothetical protein
MIGFKSQIASRAAAKDPQFLWNWGSFARPEKRELVGLVASANLALDLLNELGSMRLAAEAEGNAECH